MTLSSLVERLSLFFPFFSLPPPLQTGSGKTYTMEGPAGSDDDDRGMIPRALEQVFSCTESLQEKGWSVSDLHRD